MLIGCGKDFPSMDAEERQLCQIFVIEPDSLMREEMGRCLRELGFSKLSDVATHAEGIEKVVHDNYTHVIFDSLPTEMPILEFMQQLISINSKCVLLPTASELNLDKISDLLMQGAHGYLEKPFVLDAVDESIVSATKGKPIIDIILGAQDRNKALVDILLQLLDITSIIIRQSKTFSSAQRELPFALNAFRRSSTVARMFCIGGEECLLETIQDLSIARSETAASQIGRLRKLLKDKREAAAPTAN